MKKTVTFLIFLFFIFSFNLASASLVKPLIFNGNVAKPQDWPSIAYISSSNIKGNNPKAISFFCSASLIDPEWIITAAHCLDRQVHKKLKVIIQRYNMKNKQQGFEVLVNMRKKSSFFIASRFTREPNIKNDIALIRLPTRIETIDPIKIGSYVPKAGSPVKVAGFGMSNIDRPKEFFKLKELDGQIKKLELCSRPFYKNHPSIICVKQVNGDTCSGDSGGPLVYQGKIIGVTSFGILTDCARQSRLNWFASLPYHYQWIQSVLKTGKDRVVIANVQIKNIDLFTNKSKYADLSFTINQPLKKVKLFLDKNRCYFKAGKRINCIQKKRSTPLILKTNTAKTNSFKISASKCLSGKIIATNFSGENTIKRFKRCIKK